MKININDIQKEAIESLDSNVFISAGAGTGKTHVLVQRYIELLATKKADVPEIIAITFTEKAAKEMKDRIRDECDKRAGKDSVWERHKRNLENSRIGTIHGLCARLIKENPVPLGIDPASDVLSESESSALLDKFIHARLISLVEQEDPHTVSLVSKYGFKGIKKIFKTLLKNRIEINEIRDRFMLLNSDELHDFRRQYIKNISELDSDLIELNRHIFNIYEKIDSGYEEHKKTERLLDFDDLIIYAKRLLKKHKNTRRHYQKIIKYVLVDEYQDTDFHQKEIIFYIAEDGAIQLSDSPGEIVLSKNKLFVVGDSKQSIYRFRGADVSVFEDTKRIFEKAGRCFNLNVNFRTVPQNIIYFNNFFGKVLGIGRGGKEDYESDYIDISPNRAENKQMPALEFLSVYSDSDDTANTVRQREAELIARKILQVREKDIPFKDIAVLFRAMTDIKLYEDAFKRYKIPYYVIAGSGFYAKQEVKDILNYLKIIDNENDSISLVGVLRSPMAGLSDNQVYYFKEKDIRPPAFVKDLSYLRGIKNNIPISFLIREIIRLTNYRAILSAQYMGEQRVSNIDKLINTARCFEAKGIFSLSDFIKYLDDLVISEAREGEAAISEEESDVVKIMTIHKAKGLEFPVVIIPDVSRKQRPVSGHVLFDKKFPCLGIKVKDKDGELEDPPIRSLIKKELEKKEIAEAKRILYVASTRARDCLIYSGKFDKQKDTWADWLLDYISSNKINIITNLPAPIVNPDKQNPAPKIPETLDINDILKQTEPISQAQRTFFSATELSCHRIKSTSSFMPANNLGKKTHEFLKTWNFDANTMPQDKDIASLIKNFIKCPIFKEIKDSEIHRELPITYKHDKFIIEGIIDLLYKNKKGEWILLDYKTDNITEKQIPERAKNYETQLKAYALGLKRILNISVHKAIIYFLTPGAAHEVAIDIEGIGRELTDIICVTKCR